MPHSPGKDLRVTACPHPFKTGNETHYFAPSISLAQVLKEVQPDELLSRRAHIWVNDAYVPPELWAATYPEAGSEIAIRVVPAGKAGRTIGMVFIAIAVVVAVALGQFYAPMLLGAAAGSGGLFAGMMGGLAGMAVGIVGNMVLNALIPPASAGSSGSLAALSPAYAASGALAGNQDYGATSPTLAITGASNKENLYGPVPKMLGRFLVAPAYGARTYTESAGKDQYLRLLFVWGFSPIQIEDLRIGQTSLTNFQGVEVEHRNLTLLLTAQTIAISVAPGDRTLRRSSGSWLAEGVKAGMTLTLGGCTTPANNTYYLVSAVSALVVTFTDSTATTSEPGNGAQTASITFGDDDLTLYTQNIQEEALQTELVYDIEVTHTSEQEADELSIDVICPNGLCRVTPEGGYDTAECQVQAYYRETGTSSAWLAAGDGLIVLTGSSKSAVRANLRWTPAVRGQYDIKLKRTSGPDDLWTQSTGYWVALRTITLEDPIQDFPFPLAKTAMRIKASGQLNGTVDEFKGIVSSICPDWDPGTLTWITRATQNPASLYREVVQGDQNPKPMADSRLNLSPLASPVRGSLEYWHEYCTAQGWQYNKNIDYVCTVKDLLNEIAAAGRAAFAWVDSKLGVIIDEPQNFTIGPAFTPRNTLKGSFQGNIIYPDLPHAWRIPFRNEEQYFQQDERIVLDDDYQIGGKDAWGSISEKASGTLVVGKRYLITATEVDHFFTGCVIGDIFTALSAIALDINNKADWPPATLFEQLELPGVTDPDLIFKHGRYHIAAARLRPETIEFGTDMEWLVATRGDRFKFAHDLMLVGLSWGRVKELVLEIIGYTEDDPPEPIYSGYVLGVITDELIPMEVGKSYVLRFRLADNTSLLCPVETVAGETYEVTFTTPLIQIEDCPAVDDLFLFGESELEAIDLIIKSIQPNSDLSAKIVAVAYDPDIYTADEGTIPAFDSHISVPFEWWTPIVADVRSDGSALLRDADGSWRSRILLALVRPSALDSQIVGVEARFWLTGGTEAPILLPVVDLDVGEVSLIPVEDGRSYDYQLRYVKKDGSRGAWTTAATHVVEGKTAPPENVTGFEVAQIKEAIIFSWVKVPDRDIEGYIIAYGPVGVLREDAIILTEVTMGTSFSTALIPPGIWDFLIWARDTSQNDSELSTRETFQTTSFYQIVRDTKQGPAWLGTLTNFVRNPLTGHLNPDDQDLANANNFDLFDNYVVNPYSESTYDSPEIDLGADATVRAWARMYSQLGPGEVGENSPELWIDYKPDGGSYQGFAEWNIGFITARYFKFRLRNVASVGNICVTQFQ